MLFNSYQFLFLFFPATLLAYSLITRVSKRAGIATILIASLVFYGVWNVRFLALLGSSILLNYTLGRVLESIVENGEEKHAAHILWAGVAANLGVLAYFKYAHFFVANLNALTGTDFSLQAIILPLGISFFTFEQIGYLMDIKRGHLYRAGLLEYAFFVSFFPRLVAGPILRYSEILPQLTSQDRPRCQEKDVAIGMTIFFMGLCKKTIFADGIASYANPVFAAAATGGHPDILSAWGGALAYTLQLYFDFSGYSDMAIGAARCFGICFPMNFDSPYKATSIVDFWRRWHMTLSRFLRDYLYISLGGSRRGPVRRYVNLMLTMLLGGLWHGANWTFVAWGGLHGFYLILNHGWLEVARRSRRFGEFQVSAIGNSLGWLLTFLSVIIAWTIFRAPTFAAALEVLYGMAGVRGAIIPEAFHPIFAPLDRYLAGAGIHFDSVSGAQFVRIWLWIIGLGGIALAAPNTQQIMRHFGPTLEAEKHALPRAIAWRPTAGWAALAGTAAFFGIISITRVSEFLYWQF